MSPQQSQSPPPSARTTHTPACQSVHQQSLSAVRKAPYLRPLSHRGISCVVRASSRPKLQVYRAWLLECPLSSLLFIIIILSLPERHSSPLLFSTRFDF
uniref:Uncharacterized protein n=1 Tax=Uncultured archaeon GZfos26G2 TaxID=3386331 RepID=Q648L7_UNCAG|nr:hypothetical protein GZ37D1_7 [uncultured archaeon GZfos37D1]